MFDIFHSPHILNITEETQFELLKPFMYNAEFIQPPPPPPQQQISIIAPPPTPPSPQSQPPQPQPLSQFQPLQKDTLFWCLYIACYGLNTYNALLKYDAEMMTEKTKIIHSINTDKTHYKKVKNRLKFTIPKMNEIMADLMSSVDEINTSLLHVFCFHWKLCIYLVEPHFKCYTVISYSDADVSEADDDATPPAPAFIIFKQPDNKYTLLIFQNPSATLQEIAYIENKYIRLLCDDDHYFHTISKYKKTELEDIAQKIGYDYSKDKLKTDLYKNMLHCFAVKTGKGKDV